MEGMKCCKKLSWLMILICSPLLGAYTVKGGKILNVEEVATLSVQDHHSLLLDAMQNENYEEVIRQANIIIKNFPDTPFHQESFYFMGAAYFGQQEYDIANQHLSVYLRKQTALQHFRDAISLKFQIAEKFREGCKKHIGGVDFLP